MTPFLAIFLALITALVAGVPDEQAGESTIRVNPAIMEQSGMQFCGKRLHRAMRDLCRGNYAEFRVRSVEHMADIPEEAQEAVDSEGRRGTGKPIMTKSGIWHEGAMRFGAFNDEPTYHRIRRSISSECCRRPCGVQTMLKYCLHGLCCIRSAGRYSKHAAANDIIKRALSTAEIPSILEPSGCSREDGKRPDGQTLVPWKCGKSLVWDFTCIDTFASSYTPSTSISAGAAALIAEERKKKSYDFLSDRYLFVPLALETGGAWGKEGLKFIQEIGAKITETTGERKATSYLIQRLSICLQRGNAASILGTLPAGKELFEIFYF